MIWIIFKATCIPPYMLSVLFAAKNCESCHGGIPPKIDFGDLRPFQSQIERSKSIILSLSIAEICNLISRQTVCCGGRRQEICKAFER